MEFKRLNKYLFLFFSIFIIIITLLGKPNLYGDGREYLGMSISFSNHFTPNITQEDINERLELEIANDIHYPEGFEYAGYFEGLNGEYYSYHFWLYSLISTIPYIILDFFNMNPLKLFQMTNGLLIVFLLFRILKSTYLNEKGKLWALIVTVSSPIVFYIPWSHPEVFSFVLLFIGLLEYLDKRKEISIVYITLASLQNQSIALVALSLLIYEVLSKRRIFSKENIILVLISTIVFIPFIFYWLNFREFSLITSTGYASTDFISVKKILSLFIDPNFGLFIYMPIFFLIILYLLYKKDRKVIAVVIVMLLVAVTNSTQLNWNSGMQYINRYSVWMIPLIVIVTIHFVQKTKKKVFILILLCYLLSTGITTVFGIKNYQNSTHLEFSTLSKIIISNIPGLYNPHEEIFAERAIGRELNYYNELPNEVPIILSNSVDIRKSLILDEDGNLAYINGKVSFDLDLDFQTTMSLTSSDDIFRQKISASFGNGWYILEGSDKTNFFRWTSKESLLYFMSNESIQTKLRLDIGSFYKKNSAKIYLNNKEIYAGEITTNSQTLNLEVELLEGENILRIVSSDTEIPSNIDPNSNDNRELSFYISSIGIGEERTDILSSNMSDPKFEKGWYQLEETDQLDYFRWMSKESLLRFTSTEAKQENLVINLSSYMKNNNATIYLNEEEIFNEDISPDLTSINLEVNLQEGENSLKIISSGSEIPSNVDSNSKDTRELSFNISSISID